MKCKVCWIRQEAGWYTHSKLGGICHEKGGWYYYPGAESGLDIISKYGPYKTLIAAQRGAAELAKKQIGDGF